jgi:hypothetical protein
MRNLNYQYEPELAELDAYLDGLFIVESSTPTEVFSRAAYSSEFKMSAAQRARNKFVIRTNCDFFHHAGNEILKSGFRSLNDKNDGRRPFQFRFNDYVCVNERKLGFVKYQGRVHFAEGYFCGIELEEQEGKHDGEIDGIR